jgi:hypothetical protein
MPKWIHDRQERIRKSNPSMPESEAWALATQQAHALGKSPKGYGTSEGRAVAKAKYKTPGDDQKTAEAVMWEAFADELANIKAAGLLGDIGSGLKKALTTPIPGTPEIGGGLAHAAEKLKGLAASTSKQGPSKGFEKFQQARAAAGH